MDRKNNTQSDGLSTLTTPSDFVLRWGNRKRLRCMKVQAKEGGTHGNENNTNAKSNDSRPGQRATARIDRRAARSDLNKDSRSNNNTTTETNNGYGNGYINLRQRPASPSHRNLRNPDSSIGMRGHSNGAVRGLTSPERGNKKSGHQNNSHHHHNKTNIHYSNDGGGSGGSGSSETTHDGRRGGSSPGGDTITNVWPPKFVIALTNKEKEEDFLAIKGSKLPQRPKKRAKIIQRTVNLVCPGTWLCDLTLERYEVREKKVSKKRPRGLKAMGNMDSESSE